MFAYLTSGGKSKTAIKKDSVKIKGSTGKGKIVQGYSSETKLELKKGAGLVIGAFLGSLIGVNAVAFIMSKVLNRSLSWFRVEYSCLWLYGPAALSGTFFPISIAREPS